MNIEKELAKVVTKCLLNNGFDADAISFVLNKYDLTSYLLEEPLRIITEQVEAVSKAMDI